MIIYKDYIKIYKNSIMFNKNSINLKNINIILIHHVILYCNY